MKAITVLNKAAAITLSLIAILVLFAITLLISPFAIASYAFTKTETFNQLTESAEAGDMGALLVGSFYTIPLWPMFIAQAIWRDLDQTCDQDYVMCESTPS